MKGRLVLSQLAPLDGHPAFRASRFDALKEAVATQLAAKFVELPSQPTMLDARANRFNLPNSSLWFCAYGVPVAIQFPESDHVRVQFHHSGIGATLDRRYTRTRHQQPGLHHDERRGVRFQRRLPNRWSGGSPRMSCARSWSA
jgi:hypothetical protein